MSSSMLPRIWRTTSLFLLVSALLFLLAPSPSNILAQTESDMVPPDETTADAPNPGITAYAEAFGLPYEEAERRLLLQAAMNNVESQIAQQEPSYAGSWTQHEPEFGLVVALTDPDAEAIVAKYLEGVEWADLVTVVQHPNTLAELEEYLLQVQAATEGLAQRAELIYATGLNIQEGKVRLYSPTPDVLRDKLVQEQVLDGTPVTLEDIEFVLQEHPALPAQ